MLLSLLLELLQFHGQTHVALDLQLALEKRLLRVQFARHQVEKVIIRDDQGHVGFGLASEGHASGTVLGVNDPHNLVAGLVLDLEGVNALDPVDQILAVLLQRGLDLLEDGLGLEVGGRRRGLGGQSEVVVVVAVAAAVVEAHFVESHDDRAS